jgi:hypothetical protein
MIYHEHEQVLDFGRWSVLGSIDWLSFMMGLVVGGVVLGMPVALVLDVAPRWSLAVGSVVGIVLMLRVRGISTILRVVLLLRWLVVRRQTLDLGAPRAARPTFRIVRTRDGVPVIKRGQS